jgi:hypothetical protein
MEQQLDQTIAVLTRTPAALAALLRGLPEDWIGSNEGEGSWNAYEILGHLIFGEQTDWMPRIRMILQSGEATPFEPFDRLGHVQAIRGKSIEALLDEFALERSKSLQELHALHLQPSDFLRRGQHPALGTVTLAQLLAAWTVHDLTHLHQISRVLAHQYIDAVGPWKEYLGVLKCGGHG